MLITFNWKFMWIFRKSFTFVCYQHTHEKKNDKSHHVQNIIFECLLIFTSFIYFWNIRFGFQLEFLFMACHILFFLFSLFPNANKSNANLFNIKFGPLLFNRNSKTDWDNIKRNSMNLKNLKSRTACRCKWLWLDYQIWISYWRNFHTHTYTLTHIWSFDCSAFCIYANLICKIYFAWLWIRFMWIINHSSCQ